jgi:hypothetical protein
MVSGVNPHDGQGRAPRLGGGAAAAGGRGFVTDWLFSYKLTHHGQMEGVCLFSRRR